MLIEFSVGNYKSFKEEVTLSMVASKLTSQNKELDTNTVFPINEDISLLTSAAVYGANASGKSNLVAAMRFMREFVLTSSKDTQSGEPIPVELYALSPETLLQPASFEMVFITEGIQYRYGFEVTPERVKREWLYYVPKTREVRLFEREHDQITLAKDSFSEGDGLQQRTRSNALFISVLAQFNSSTANLILDWFRSYSIISGLYDQQARGHTFTLLSMDSDAVDIVSFIQSLDVGINGIQMTLNEFDKSTLAALLKLSITPDGKRLVNEEMLDQLRKTFAPFSIITQHRSYTADGHEAAPVSFILDQQESEGTKKIFSLAGQILVNLHSGTPLVIDEFDARLHPLITREIIRLFNTKETNPKHAQLIFMTHDTNLLDKDFLRRDQIWFTEKDRFGASHLYSLAEFKVRNDASYGKDYIQGKYGAIPFLGDLRRVVEEANA